MSRRHPVVFARCVVALLVLVLVSGSLLELAGDCGSEHEETRSAGGAICLHGDDDHTGEAPDRCPTDHHGPQRCSCSCHHTSMLTSSAGLRIPVRVSFLGSIRPKSLPHRSERPDLRPPIAG